MAAPGSAEELLEGVKLLLSESLVRQVGACFQFEIGSEDGRHCIYYVDLSQGDGSPKFQDHNSLLIHITQRRLKQPHTYISISRSLCVLQEVELQELDRRPENQM